MPQSPFDDMPQPYGPGWRNAWPGEPPRDPSRADAPVVGGGHNLVVTPADRPVVHSLSEFMRVVRAAVPYLGNGRRHLPASPDASGDLARHVIGRALQASNPVSMPSASPAAAAHDPHDQRVDDVRASSASSSTH